ncbi:putative rRNA-processing protein EBP2 isoform X2 [Glandiceps talaboti]
MVLAVEKMADSDDESVASFESVDSDTKLRLAFSRGEMKPGLYVPTRAPRQYVNNVNGLQEKIENFKKDLDWIERMEITAKSADDEKTEKSETDDTDTMNNDFKREIKFYHQAQSAVLEALPKLRKLNIPTRRPEDYFAEMAKSDEHMRKVRQKLLSKQLAMERSEKAKKLRDLRKYGKEVQREVLQKRRKEKKELLESVKKFRKGQKDKLNFTDDINIMPPSDFKGKGKKAKKETQVSGKPGPNPKRTFKNKKFGLGGQKKRSKYNTAESAADTSKFRTFKHSKGKQGGKGKKRFGKARRQKSRVKARR